jgi:hypothetical protein
MPDRLIEEWEGETSKEYTLRVVRGADLGSVPYLALSHCRGTPQPVRLMKGDNTYYHFHVASFFSKLIKMPFL